MVDINVLNKELHKANKESEQVHSGLRGLILLNKKKRIYLIYKLIRAKLYPGWFTSEQVATWGKELEKLLTLKQFLGSGKIG